MLIIFIAWKVSKNGVISGPYFSVFGLNTGIYGVLIAALAFNELILWYSIKIGVSKNLPNSQENTCVGDSYAGTLL